VKLIKAAIFLWVLIAATGGPSHAQGSAPVQYLYDDVGRLIKVVDPSGNVATYNYDAVGNLLSITRSTVPANNGLAILSFAPQQGLAAQMVTIQGQGFSSTPGSNSVQFNGTAATVSASTPTTLTVSVPVSAVSGPISVSVAGNSATSDSSFTVLTLTSIAVAPLSVSITPAGRQQFSAAGTFGNGTTRDVTASVVWNSSNALLATISNSAGSQGVATGVSGGTVTITATSGAVSSSAALTVLPFASISISPVNPLIPQGGTVQFSATGNGPSGNSTNVTTTATWSSSAVSMATISNAAGNQGLATGVTPGPANICASSQGVSGCTSATVVPVLVSMVITPANGSLPKGEKQPLSATGTFSDGSIQDVTSTASWSSSNPLAAIVSNLSGAKGLVTALDLATTTISAVSAQISASTNLTVTAPVPVSVTVTPAVAAISQGGAAQFSAATTLSDGTAGPAATATATWASSDPTVATISNAAGSQGLATGVGPGAVTISATLGTLTGSASLVATSTTGSVFSRFAYVANSGDATISIYTANPATGQLRTNGYVAEVPGASPGALALDPAGKFLFVANSGSATVSVYAVNQTNGTLTQVTGSPFATGLGPSSVVVDPTGNFVYVVNSGDFPGDVSAFAYDPTSGVLTAVAGQPFPAGNGSSTAAIDPKGQFLYVTNSTDGTISAYTIGPTTGVLTAVVGQPFAAGTQPTGVTIDPSGNFVIVANGQAGGGGGSSQLRSPGFGGTDYWSAAGGSASRGGASSAATTATQGFSAAAWSGHVSSSANPQGRFVLASYRSEEPVTPDPTRAVVGMARPSLAIPQAGTQVGPGPGVSVLSIDPISGALTPIVGSPFAAGGAQAIVSVVVDPTGKFVYGNAIAGGVSAFTLDSSVGTLTLLAGSPYSTNFAPTSLAVDPSGLFVYVTDRRSNEITAFGISPGAGALVSLGSLPARPGTSSIVMSSGTAPVKYVPQSAYVANSGGVALSGNTAGSNNIVGFLIDPGAGGLTGVIGSPFTDGLFPAFVTTDLLGRFLAVVNTCSDSGCAAMAGSMSVFDIDPNLGTLAVAPGSPFLSGPGAVGGTIDPSGRFVYVLNSKNESISGYAISGSSGSLTPIPGSPFVIAGVFGTPAAMTIDPTGQFLYVATGCPNDSCNAGTISVFRIDPSTGNLTSQFPPQSFGVSPSSLVIEPRGEFLYVTDSVSANVIAISLVDATFGLSEITVSPFAAGSAPSSVAVEPTGKFLYVANFASNNVSAYTIDSGGSGLLTPIPGSPFVAGANPVSVTTDVSGRFVYVANEGDNTVSVFTIDPVSGALTPAAGSPFPAGTVPISVTTTGRIQ
jgi:YD repeat-containing protein